MADTDYNNEIWKNIPGWEGLYQASSLGRVRSLERTVSGVDSWGRSWSRNYPSKLLTQHKVGIGYKVVCLTVGGRSQNKYVHRLVCAAFYGDCPIDKRDAAHEDGDPANNNPANLRWASSAENQRDKLRHGRALIGERHHKARLTEDDVREIRRRSASGEANNAIGKDFNCSAGMIRSIVVRRSWKHIE